MAKIKELVELKTRLAQANTVIYDKIFELSELKGLVQFYRQLEIKDGLVNERYNENLRTFEAVLKVNQRDMLVADLEARIETLQDELDEHNATTEI